MFTIDKLSKADVTDGAMNTKDSQEEYQLQPGVIEWRI